MHRPAARLLRRQALIFPARRRDGPPRPDAAQRHWPELTDRKALLLRLATTGAEAIAAEAAKQRAAIDETAGVLTGLYKPGELELLRQDWPE